MFLLTATIFIGVASRYTDDHDREWWGRAGAWVLIASISWTGLSALVVFGPGLLSYTPGTVTSLGGLSGVISLLLGFSSRTTATTKAKPSIMDVILDRAVRLAAPVFIACLLVLITLITSLLMKGIGDLHGDVWEGSAIGLRVPPDVWGHAVLLHNSPPWLVIELAAAFIAAGRVHVAGHQHQQVFVTFDLSQSADSGLFGRFPRETPAEPLYRLRP